MHEHNGNTAKSKSFWKPLEEEKLGAIKDLFIQTYPQKAYGDLSQKIAAYWIDKLQEVWCQKKMRIKERDLAYDPADPLARIEQKTVLIAYADSIYDLEEKTLTTLDRFLKEYFPAVQGMHMLPCCEVIEDRFNDGYFSQVTRTRIHQRFGDNEHFAAIMERFFSMADFVLNHVDIENPHFQDYLNGNDEAGECFYVFTEERYKQLAEGEAFKSIFRPRPFPLFSIYKRKPKESRFARMSQNEKTQHMQKLMESLELPADLINILVLFNIIKNDQMLLDHEYEHIARFRSYLETEQEVHFEDIFTVSTTQETQHTPYVFRPEIQNRQQLLEKLDFDQRVAKEATSLFESTYGRIYGEEIRALTTFSHVQVDLNTSTFTGLKTLADDFTWYLSLDLNMLRLDAANFAFKKWGTPCFGLPEVKNLMKILILSMDCVAPRIIANLEVNDTLSNILQQMADTSAPPPMMYDFHLPCMLPLVFNSGDARPLVRIFDMIARYNIPQSSIRFSLVESHDGKSIRGSMDLLSLAERQNLADSVEDRGGEIKYKAVPTNQISKADFEEVCREAGLDSGDACRALFKEIVNHPDILYLRDSITDAFKIAGALGMSVNTLEKKGSLKFFVNKVIDGREPYELCTSTRNSLAALNDPVLEAKRYLSFFVLAFALMGRNVKSVYFNDLLGLPNDHERFEASGELRDIKRTKSLHSLASKRLVDPRSFESKVSRCMNNLIALVDFDPAFNFRSNEDEAKAVLSKDENVENPVAVVHAAWQHNHTLVLVNLTQKTQNVQLDLFRFGLAKMDLLIENISNREIFLNQDNQLTLTLESYECLWLTRKKIDIPDSLLL